MGEVRNLQAGIIYFSASSQLSASSFGFMALTLPFSSRSLLSSVSFSMAAKSCFQQKVEKKLIKPLLTTGPALNDWQTNTAGCAWIWIMNCCVQTTLWEMIKKTNSRLEKISLVSRTLQQLWPCCGDRASDRHVLVLTYIGTVADPLQNCLIGEFHYFIFRLD